jgi:septal ring-binding cell division protein DamX
MPLETLEEVRLLSNLESNRHKLLQIVLFGQPELDDHLAVPNMRQLRERITHGFRLEPLVRADIDSYVDFRMRAAGYRGPTLFAPQAMKRIARVSEGLTRRINILADKALLAAFADGAHQVTAQHARRAIRDSEFAGRRGLPRKWLLLGAGLAAGLLAGGAIHLYYYYSHPNAPQGGTATPAAAIPTAPPASATPLGGSPGAPVAAPAVTASAPATAPSAGPLPASVPPVTAELHSAVQQSAPPATPLEPPAPPVAAPPLPPAAAPTAAAPTSPEAKPAAVVRAADEPGGPVPPASGKLAQERFAATQQWLKTAPTGHYTIQLLTVRAADMQTLERFLRQAAERVDIEQIRVYSVKIGGEQHYSATYGLYPSLEATIDAMGDLPSTFKARGPYHRSVTLMRRQNQE